jgi:hypothetical protein
MGRDIGLPLPPLCAFTGMLRGELYLIFKKKEKTYIFIYTHTHFHIGIIPLAFLRVIDTR